MLLLIFCFVKARVPLVFTKPRVSLVYPLIEDLIFFLIFLGITKKIIPVARHNPIKKVTARTPANRNAMAVPTPNKKKKKKMNKTTAEDKLLSRTIDDV
jgi:hypothetical protein